MLFLDSLQNHSSLGTILFMSIVRMPSRMSAILQ